MSTAINERGGTGADNIRLGITLVLISVVIFGVQDAVSKLLVQDISPYQLAMMRYWGFAAFSLFMVMRQGPLRQAFVSRAPRVQLARGFLLVADIWLFAMALQSVPLAELQSISLVYPLLVTLFAIPLLGEKVGIFRLSAVVVGFLGAMVIVRPGGLPLDAGVLYGIASCSIYALYLVLTRKVGKLDSTATSMAYTGVVGLILTSAVGVFHWAPLEPRDIGLVVLVMATTCLGHGLMIKALSLAPASVLQPFNYFTLPWAIVLSYLIFDHLIDPISLIGAAIIVGAGLVVMARERLKGSVTAGAETPLPGKE